MSIQVEGKLLYLVVKKATWEKLGALKQEIGSATRNELTAEEKDAATPLIIDLVERATIEFFAEQRARYARKG